MKKTLFILTLIFLIIATKGYSQTYYYKKYTVEDGLSQSQVIAVTDDEKGRIWTGTNGGGISIFDGNKFTNITTDDGLPHNVVFSLLRDNDNNIWAGTYDGLAKISGNKIKTFDTEQGLGNSQVYCLVQDKNKVIWIGTRQGVYILKNDTITKLIGDKLTENALINTIFIDSKNNKWIGTAGFGVIKYKNKTFKKYTKQDNLYSNTVRAVSEDINGNIWFGTDLRISVLIEDSICTSNQQQTYMGVYKDSNNKLWFINYNGWLDNFTTDKHNIDFKTDFSKQFKEEQFYAIFKDRENNFWMGSENGLIKFPNFSIRNYSTLDGIINDNVYAIFSSDTALFVGTQKGVSIVKILKSGTPNIYNINSKYTGRGITTIAEDNYGNVWFGSITRLIRYNKTSNTYTKYYHKELETEFRGFEETETVIDSNITSENIKHIFNDNKGVLWISTDNGITLVKNNKFINLNNKFPSIPPVVVNYTMQTKSGDYWFATEENGAYKYSNNKITHYGKDEGLEILKIIAIKEDKQGKMWLATTEGLIVFDGKTFEKIDKTRGLVSNTIYLIQFDNNNNLYIGTNKGIDVLDVNTYNKKGKVIIKSYGSEEGFIGQECNRNASCIDANGELWFGTVKGITGFNPDELHINKITPIVSFTDIRIDFEEFEWQKYSKDNILKLPYNKNHLTFDYIATSFTITEKVRYKYMLEGLNDEWSPPVKKIEQDYPILPSGEYTFKVIACNNDGYWTETPTEFSFIIKKPFWETWWFYTIAGLLIIIIIFAYTKYREANLKKEKIILEKKVQERTQEVVKQKEIVEQKNKDITDSINYAKNIQEALLPNLKDIEKRLPESMVLYKPKDIVSGDFYWLSQKGDDTFISAADCTGHGVPGAFMSMLGIAFLDEIVNTESNLKASDILNKLRENVIVSLRQGEEGRSKDGMDMALCKINHKKNKLEFAGANNPLYIIRNNELIEIKGDKMPIGFYLKTDDFNNHEISLEKDDVIYMFSDGYADQFGGPKGKKYKYKKFKNLLLEIHKKPLAEQKEILDRSTTDWRGNINQLDDIIIIGIKI